VQAVENALQAKPSVVKSEVPASPATSKGAVVPSAKQAHPPASKGIVK
jgi:hypothetical protein